MALPKYEFIDTPEAWEKCTATLANAPRMAVDIEANSLYVYREEVCLIQISIPGHDYIVDPFAGLDMRQLVLLLENPFIEKVFHACEYDLILLKRRYDANIKNLFDTMWAARLMGYKNMGLAAFLESHFGVELSKKYQKSNWGMRPLSEEHLEYAQNDTHYLLELRDLLADEIEKLGRMDEAREIFSELCDVRVPERLFDPDGYWSVKGAGELRPSAMAVFRELYLCRETIAQELNKPPFKVMNTSVLLYLAKVKPKNVNALRNIRGVPSMIKDRYAKKIVEAVVAGSVADAPKRPAKKARVDSAVSDRYVLLTEWRKRMARERGVESDVILKRDTIWAIALAGPESVACLQKIAGLGPHRLSLYGESILEALAGKEAEASEDEVAENE